MFAPLNDLVASLPAEQRNRWDRLFMLSDRRSRDAKPLLYQHPLTGQDTLCFHLGGWPAAACACGCLGCGLQCVLLSWLACCRLAPAAPASRLSFKLKTEWQAGAAPLPALSPLAQA